MSLAIPELFILSRFESKAHSLSGIQDLVNIFQDSRKYLQIGISHGKKAKVVIVVASSPCDSHNDIRNEFSAATRDQKLKTNYRLGGGRIQWRDKALIVYDRSIDYGEANHEETARILREYFQKIGVVVDIEVK